MLSVTGVAVALIVMTTRQESTCILTQTPTLWLILDTAYFTSMFCLGILTPLEIIKQKIIERVRVISKQKKNVCGTS